MLQPEWETKKKVRPDHAVRSTNLPLGRLDILTMKTKVNNKKNEKNMRVHRIFIYSPEGANRRPRTSRSGAHTGENRVGFEVELGS